jgi:hypothetical protein
MASPNRGKKANEKLIARRRKGMLHLFAFKKMLPF